MTKYITLLRGINVGGKNKLKMAELKALLAEMGVQNVQTYIQSGNVVLTSGIDDANLLATQISDAIERRCQFRPRTLVLPLAEFKVAIDANPYPQAGTDPKLVHLYFLAEPAANADIDGLEALSKPSEQYLLTDSVFYLYAPEGIGRSKLAAKAERLLGVAATARNWRTVTKLLALAQDEE